QDLADAQPAGGVDGPAHEHLDHGGLERRADVGDERRPERGVPPDEQANRRLQAGEREVRRAVADVGHREGDGPGIAVARRALDDGPPRIAQAEELGDLAEGLAAALLPALTPPLL